MHPWQKVFRSVHLDPAIDRALDLRAKDEGVGKAALIVAYIEEGLCIAPVAAPAGTVGESPAISVGTSPKIMRTMYLDQATAGTLSSRADFEGMPSSRLIERFCAEGLARPPSGGRILRRTQESFISEQKAKIEHLLRESVEAIKRLREARKEFRASCPHLRLAEDVSVARCEDCGAAVTRP